MFKVGDRVVYGEGDDRTFIVSRIEEEGRRIYAKDVYSGKEGRFNSADLKKTSRNPVVLVETYGDEWKNTVASVLGKNKVKYKAVPQERRRDITLFYVDSKKLAAVKEILDAHYKSELT